MYSGMMTLKDRGKRGIVVFTGCNRVSGAGRKGQMARMVSMSACPILSL